MRQKANSRFLFIFFPECKHKITNLWSRSALELVDNDGLRRRCSEFSIICWWWWWQVGKQLFFFSLSLLVFFGWQWLHWGAVKHLPLIYLLERFHVHDVMYLFPTASLPTHKLALLMVSDWTAYRWAFFWRFVAKFN